MWKRNICARTRLIAAVCLLLVVGCNSAKPTGKLNGRVTFEGEAVTDAKIQVQSSETGNAADAVLDQDGNFKFESPLTVGQYVVSIIPMIEVPPAGTEPVTTVLPNRSDIPAKYRSGSTSDLVVDVSEKENAFDVEMTAEN